MSVQAFLQIFPNVRADLARFPSGRCGPRSLPISSRISLQILSQISSRWSRSSSHNLPPNIGTHRSSGFRRVHLCRSQFATATSAGAGRQTHGRLCHFSCLSSPQPPRRRRPTDAQSSLSFRLPQLATATSAGAGRQTHSRLCHFGHLSAPGAATPFALLRRSWSPRQVSERAIRREEGTRSQMMRVHATEVLPRTTTANTYFSCACAPRCKSSGKRIDTDVVATATQRQARCNISPL